MDFSQEISKTIEKVEEKITELKAQQTLLKSLYKEQAPDEELWHKLCETPLRNSDVLATFVQNIYPEAEDIRVCPNDVKFRLYGFDIEIPTTCARGIEVSTCWYNRLLLEEPEFALYGADLKMQQYFTLVDSGASGWIDRARLVVPNGTIYRPWFLWLKWMAYYKWHCPDRAQWEKKLEEKRAKYAETLEKQRKEREKQHKKAVFLFHKVIPMLARFSTVHDMHKAGMFGTRLEEIARLENI